MLLKRSILVQVCLLLTFGHYHCQDYESSYGVEEGEDHSNIQDESDHPDYSKYYSVDSSAPLLSAGGNGEASGFLSPIEFSGFFGPSSIEFGASGKQEVKQPQSPFAVPEPKQTGFAAVKQEFPSQFYSGASAYPKDYFEEAQKQQQAAEQQEANNETPYELAPGPNYISHHLPLKNSPQGSYSDVDAVLEKAQKSKKSKDYDSDDKDYEKSVKEGEKYKLADYDYTNPKYTDYNIGKASSTVSQQPEAPGYFEKFTKPASPTPYQKFSFQPVSEGSEFKNKYLDELISTVAPFNPAYNKLATTPTTLTFEGQSSEAIPAHLKGKNCRRVKKHVEDDKEAESDDRDKRQAINCFVCENAETNDKYTQCSYTSEDTPTSQYSGASERYSIPAREGDGFRYKRYSGDEYNADPYEYIKKQSQKAHEAQESKGYEDFKYVPEYEAEDKSYSEVQSEKISKNAANCKKEEKDGMTCTVCKDAKTGGNYEQCSYTVQPKEKKYAYVTEKKYDSNDEPEERSESKPLAQTKDVKDDTTERRPKQRRLSKTRRNEESSKRLEDYKPSEEFKANARFGDKTKYRNTEAVDHSAEEPKREASEEYSGPQQFNSRPSKSPSKSSSKLVDDDPYEVPKHFAESTLQEKKSDNKEEPSEHHHYEDDEESAEAEDGDAPSDEKQQYKDIDEYHFKLFPEFSNEESQQAEVVAGNPAETTRKDVEEVLAEFSKKDRSACQKAQRKGMTCYLCVDAKGIQHEECMYVSESQPQASHVAYHEVQQIKKPDNAKPVASLEQTLAPSETKQKRFFKKVTTTAAPFTLETAASEEFETSVPYKSDKSRRKGVKKSKRSRDHDYLASDDSERIADDGEPTPKTPSEFVVDDEEGAFSHETKPVYSKLHGAKLPLYMVEKSEFEKEFDEFAGAF